ncbi:MULTISPECIES: acyl carrier protein [Streptomyces]|uniref:Acyl carrier protein n=3 Tax=Streptomyces TaxID=1883 RepID=A0A3S9PJN8_STRLT|nr:acyl carrier protein [Streptomyces luteoverticillatus]AZQ72649.1 acyl carrier protein [Streptomyces luteoverticillatus]
MPENTDTLTIEQIRDWFTERVAFYLERPQSEVDPDAKLVEIGLDSVYALTICGDIEDHFGFDVEPTVTWDHPTVNAMARYLHTEITAGR